MQEDTRYDSHNQRLRSNLQENLELLQISVDFYQQHPEKADVQRLKGFFETPFAFENDRRTVSDLTVEDKLTVLNRLEEWYRTHNIPFPNPQWLTTQRDKLGAQK